jgi:hypothetical protein
MKKYLLILLVVLSGLPAIKAQDGGDSKAEKIQSLKIAFITQKLQLTPDEAQRFWPVYNQYQNEINTFQLESKNGAALPNEEKLLDIRKKYLSAFEKVLGPEKANNLFNAERDFRTILIRRLQNRNQQRMNQFRR